jgi:hypothetical protein
MTESSALIGALGDDAGAGAAYFFVREDGEWREAGKLVADDRTSGAEFGWTIAISNDTAVISALRERGTGAAYIFRRAGDRWSQEAELVAADGRDGDGFGWKVAISEDTVVIGAPFADDSRGAAYVFRRRGDGWRQEAKLVDESAESESAESLGSSVAISGDTIFVGAPYADDAAGAGFAYVRNGVTWTFESRLSPDLEPGGDKLFGNGAAMSGNTLVVGADEEESSAHDAGAAYVFVRVDGSWQRQAKLIASNPSDEGHFGLYLATSGDAIVVGAAGGHAPDSDVDTGSAYLFVRSGVDVSQRALLFAGVPGEEDAFGLVAMAGTTVIAGAPWHDGLGEDAGAAYVYELAALLGEHESGVQVTPDGRRVLISKDVDGPAGSERWSITRNLDDDSVTGNVFPSGGGAPSFVFCSVAAADPAEVTLECSGANACPQSPCLASEWTPLGTVRVPASFFEPPAAT